MRIVLLITMLLFFACNQNIDEQKDYKFLENYATISSLLNEHQLVIAAKYHDSLSPIVGRSNWDSLKLVHQLYGFKILLTNNYFDSGKKIIPLAYAKMDSLKFKDIFFEFRRLETVCLQQTEDNLKCIEKSLEILPYFEENKIHNRVCGLEANIGWSYFLLLQWENARTFTRKALNHAMENNLTDLYADYYQRLATIHAGKIQYDTTNKQQCYDSAIYYYKMSFNNMDTTTPSWDLSNYYINLSGLNHLMEYYEKAIICSEKAAMINQKMNDEVGVSMAYTNMGLAYKGLSNFEKAEYYYSKAFEIARKFNDLKTVSDLNKNLALLYYKTGDYKKSATFFQDHISYYFQNLNESSENQAMVLAKKYETARIEKELAEERNLKLEAKAQTQNLYWAIGFISLILILGAFIYWLNLKNKSKLAILKRQFEDEQLKKDTENLERIRISRNLHDNLGAYATSVIHGIEALNYVNLDTNSIKELKYSAEQIVVNLKNVVIELNQKEMHFLDFIDIVKSELLRICSAYKDIDFDISDNIEFNKILNPDQQLHLKSIVLEMVQNSLKHSNASEISLQFIENGSNITIICLDNGKGIENTTIAAGNGMTNMKHRAQLLGAFYSIENSEKGGVLNRLTIPKWQ